MDFKTIDGLISHIANLDEPELSNERAEELLLSVKKSAARSADSVTSDGSNISGSSDFSVSSGNSRRASFQKDSHLQARPEVLTMEEAAAFLRVSIEDLEKEFNTLPVFSIGGRMRIRRSQLTEWIEERERMIRGHRVLSLINE